MSITKCFYLLALMVLSTLLFSQEAEEKEEEENRVDLSNTTEKKNPNVSCAHLIPENFYQSNYPLAFEGLLKSFNQASSIRINTAPITIKNLEDERLFECPFLYFNLGDSQWDFNAIEIQRLKDYLERGGFLYIDAGIQASFLEHSKYQNHSFAEWKPSKKLEELFDKIIPGKKFKPIEKNHEIFKTFRTGLPDSSKLPDTVKDFVINEKWPGGTYSLVGLTINGRLAVVASPIVAMGWSKSNDGRWAGNIMLRVKESGKDLDKTLSSAKVYGDSFEVTNEDGTTDTVFIKDQKPAWVHESNGKWRIYKYYGGHEINDFTHQYFTQLGINIISYSLTH